MKQRNLDNKKEHNLYPLMVCFISHMANLFCHAKEKHSNAQSLLGVMVLIGKAVSFKKQRLPFESQGNYQIK